jgi:hypothetical protein
VPQDLTTFVSALRPTTECRNGRLPRITQPDAFTHGFRFVHTRTVKSCEPMGHSREPPVFARFAPTSDQTKFERVARYTPKRLPSRLCAITRRINPLQFRGRERAATSPYSGATAAGTMMASRIPCTIFLSGGTIVAKTPPKTTSRGETTK